jgi:hypothetical protein
VVLRYRIHLEFRKLAPPRRCSRMSCCRSRPSSPLRWKTPATW